MTSDHNTETPSAVSNVSTSGFVPVYQPHAYDLSYGLAEGRDLVGPFSHFSGPYGPFGFWANLFHDRR